MEIIKLIDGSNISANKTLKELGVPSSTFYKWYKKYLAAGFDALEVRGKRNQNRVWNKIPQEERNSVVEIALNKEYFTCREIARYITDNDGWHISESSVYRILRERGLITAPHHIVLSAADEYKKKNNARKRNVAD